jgi:hypothetical protein
MIEAKGGALTIKTTRGNHASWLSNSSIRQVILAIQSHANIRFRVLRYRLKVFIAGIILFISAFILTSIPLLITVITAYASIVSSAILFIIFFARLQDISERFVDH